MNGTLAFSAALVASASSSFSVLPRSTSDFFIRLLRSFDNCVTVSGTLVVVYLRIRRLNDFWRRSSWHILFIIQSCLWPLPIDCCNMLQSFSLGTSWYIGSFGEVDAFSLFFLNVAEHSTFCSWGSQQLVFSFTNVRFLFLKQQRWLVRTVGVKCIYIRPKEVLDHSFWRVWHFTHCQFSSSCSRRLFSSSGSCNVSSIPYLLESWCSVCKSNCSTGIQIDDMSVF